MSNNLLKLGAIVAIVYLIGTGANQDPFCLIAGILIILMILDNYI